MKQGFLSILKVLGIYIAIVVLSVVKGILSAMEFISGNLAKASDKGLSKLNKAVTAGGKKA